MGQIASRNFNPRSRVGNDTPATVMRRYGDNFNPRSRVGNDVPALTQGNLFLRFQSTFPRGERQKADKFLLLLFNISIHVPAWGTTKVRAEFEKQKKISIHVPAWGTTSCSTSVTIVCPFQSTFPRGERHFGCSIIIPCCRFQSTFPRGERR